MVNSPVLDLASLPEQIRVSVGTAIVMGLLEGKLDAEPTTAYLMTYKDSKCSANCGFCPQAKSSKSKAELLSRVSWPSFSTLRVIEAIVNAVQAGKIKRVCIQTLNYPIAIHDICGFVQELKQSTRVPVSASCQPLNSQNMWNLAQAGVDRIGIALDAATEQLFYNIKGVGIGGPYKWEKEFTLMRTAIGVFGEGNVSTHLIVGLGETEKEAAKTIQTFVDIGILPALFAFTPVRGTALEGNPQPKLETYRRMQLARYLIVNALARFEEMIFDEAERLTDFGIGTDALINVVNSGLPFLTSGCVDCNRPFYNEKPSGPIYNYPRKLKPQEIEAVKCELERKTELAARGSKKRKANEDG
ncbi:MAG TPA: radical SAM protein [Candidatus Nanoarchaeia archaeon]|nr:radical SAM protein [Candidatus Nanoarchaeia archaeon]